MWDTQGRVVSEQTVERVDEDDEDELRGLVDAVLASNTIVTVSATQDLAFFVWDGQLVQTRQLVGYNDEIVDLALVQTHYLAVASNNSQLRIYRLDTQDRDHDVALVDGHSDMVLSIDTNGEWLVSGSKDHTARIWARVNDGRQDGSVLVYVKGMQKASDASSFRRRKMRPLSSQPVRTGLSSCGISLC